MSSFRVKCVGRCSERGGGGDEDDSGRAVVVVVSESGFLALPLRRGHGNGTVVVVVAACLLANEVLDLATVFGFPMEGWRLQGYTSVCHHVFSSVPGSSLRCSASLGYIQRVNAIILMSARRVHLKSSHVVEGRVKRQTRTHP